MMTIDQISDEAFQIVVRAVSDIVNLVKVEVPDVDIQQFKKAFEHEVYEDEELHDFFIEIVERLLGDHAAAQGEDLLKSLF